MPALGGVSASQDDSGDPESGPLHSLGVSPVAMPQVALSGVVVLRVGAGQGSTSEVKSWEAGVSKLAAPLAQACEVGQRM